MLMEKKRNKGKSDASVARHVFSQTSLFKRTWANARLSGEGRDVNEWTPLRVL